MKVKNEVYTTMGTFLCKYMCVYVHMDLYVCMNAWMDGCVTIAYLLRVIDLSLLCYLIAVLDPSPYIF